MALKSIPHTTHQGIPVDYIAKVAGGGRWGLEEGGGGGGGGGGDQQKPYNDNPKHCVQNPKVGVRLHPTFMTYNFFLH